MDFASQLANLQKQANAAQRGSGGRNNRDRSPNGGRRGGPPPNQRHGHHGGRGDNHRSNYYTNPRRDNRRHHPQNNYYGRNQPHPNKRQRREIDGPYRSPKWNNMKRAVDRLPVLEPAKETAPCTHLCLLAITINELHFEEIWKEWADRQSISISLICHAKEPGKVQSEWLKSRMLVVPPRMGRGNDFAPPTYHTRYPKWGSIEITRAMIDLCLESLKIGTDSDMKDPRFSTNRYAFKQQASVDGTDETPMIPKVDKVLFISETCLPIASLTDELLSPTSVVNARDTPNNGFSRQLQFDKIHSLVPKKYKADQWMMLARYHLEAIIDRLPPNFWECFVDCNASDELYFPTALALLGIVENSNEVAKKRITYTDWSMGAKNPATFQEKAELKKVVTEARKEGCLVARKFEGITLEDWRNVVFPDDNVETSTNNE